MTASRAVHGNPPRRRPEIARGVGTPAKVSLRVAPVKVSVSEPRIRGRSVPNNRRKLSSQSGADDLELQSIIPSNPVGDGKERDRKNRGLPEVDPVTFGGCVAFSISGPRNEPAERDELRDRNESHQGQGPEEHRLGGTIRESPDRRRGCQLTSRPLSAPAGPSSLARSPASPWTRRRATTGNRMMAPFAPSLLSSRCHGRKARRSHVKPEAREEIGQRAMLILHAP